MTNVVPVRERGKSSTTARLHKKPCMDAVSEAGTPVVMVENVLDATEAAESLHLSPEEVASKEALL